MYARSCTKCACACMFMCMGVCMCMCIVWYKKTTDSPAFESHPSPYKL